jgi:hypothetical protein
VAWLDRRRYYKSTRAKMRERKKHLKHLWRTNPAHFDPYN